MFQCPFNAPLQKKEFDWHTTTTSFACGMSQISSTVWPQCANATNFSFYFSPTHFSKAEGRSLVYLFAQQSLFTGFKSLDHSRRQGAVVISFVYTQLVYLCTRTCSLAFKDFRTNMIRVCTKYCHFSPVFVFFFCQK